MKKRVAYEVIDSMIQEHARWLAGDINGTRADFTGMNISKKDFEGADLRFAIFNKANLSGANFKNALLSDAQFIKANLQFADLERADIIDACFHNANLSYANLDYVKIRYRDIERIGRKGTALFKANITEVGLSRFAIQDLKFTRKILVDVTANFDYDADDNVVVDTHMKHDYWLGSSTYEEHILDRHSIGVEKTSELQRKIYNHLNERARDYGAAEPAPSGITITTRPMILKRADGTEMEIPVMTLDELNKFDLEEDEVHSA